MDMETWKHEDTEKHEKWRYENIEKWRNGDMKTWQHGDMETWTWTHGQGDMETSNEKRKPRRFSFILKGTGSQDFSSPFTSPSNFLWPE
jgi:hypothetical protein